MRSPWEIDLIIKEVNVIRKDILRVLYDKLDELDEEFKLSSEKHADDMADQEGAYDK